MKPCTQSGAVAQARDPLFDVTARCLALTCGMAACRLYHGTPDGQLAPLNGNGPRLDPAAHPLLTRALAGQVAGCKRSAADAWSPEWELLDLLEAEAVLALPLLFDDRAVGVALLVDRQLPAISKSRLLVACEQAAALGAALPETLAREAGWLDEMTELRQREQELATLCALSTVPHETPVELLTRVLESILKLTHLESGLLLFHGSGLAPTGTAIGLAPGMLEAVNTFEDQHGMHRLYAVLAGGETPLSPDNEALLAAFQAQLPRWVVLPLKSGTRISGVLVLAGAEYHQLSDNLSRLLSTIIHQLLLSMELYQALGTMEALVAERTAALLASHRQLEQTVEELQRVDQFKTDFLSNVSHELRTPLCGIIGYGEFLAEGVYGELLPEQQEVLSQLVTNSYQLMELINNLLDLSRIDAGKLQLYREPIELPVLIEQAAGKVRPQAQRKSLDLQVVLHAMPLVEVDPARIVQVLVNLLANAIKFTPEGGSVTVTVEASEDVATVEVRDTGIGIDPEVLPRLFMRFSQGDSSTTRQFGGTGLGLAISRELIELHGQRIWGESTLEVGSAFRFTLPLWKHAAEPIVSKG